MCILPVDVTSVICLFYQKLLTFIASDQYGITCNNEDIYNDLNNIWNQYEFSCFSNDYVRELILDNADTLDLCDRDTFVATGSD